MITTAHSYRKYCLPEAGALPGADPPNKLGAGVLAVPAAVPAGGVSGFFAPNKPPPKRPPPAAVVGAGAGVVVTVDVDGVAGVVPKRERAVEGVAIKA